MELHTSGYIETCCFFFQAFHFQFTMTFDRRHKNVSRSGFFQPPHLTRISSSLFLFTVLCCSLIWAYFNLLIKFVRSSLCNQELNHVRLTQSSCERIFLTLLILILCAAYVFLYFPKPNVNTVDRLYFPSLSSLSSSKKG